MADTVLYTVMRSSMSFDFVMLKMRAGQCQIPVRRRECVQCYGASSGYVCGKGVAQVVWELDRAFVT